MDHIAGTAVLDGVVVEVKYSSPETAIVAGSKQGVYRFYLNGNDREGHKRILNYMLDNGLVRRTKSSKLYNISIKYDSKTYAGKYKGSGFSGKIKLANYVDLETGSLYEGGSRLSRKVELSSSMSPLGTTAIGNTSVLYSLT